MEGEIMREGSAKKGRERVDEVDNKGMEQKLKTVYQHKSKIVAFEDHGKFSPGNGKLKGLGKTFRNFSQTQTKQQVL